MKETKRKHAEPASSAKAAKSAPIMGNLIAEFSGTSVFAVSKSDGIKLLTTSDEFVLSQSPFDRQARLNLEVTVTKEMYFQFVSSQVMDWSTAEISALKAIYNGSDSWSDPIIPKFTRLKEFTLPKSIFLVKTTGHEEGAAAYTRNMETIVLPANMVNTISSGIDPGDPLHPAANYQFLQDVIVHESFHIWSKNNKVKREELYSLFKYHSTGEPVPLPKEIEINKITNPDTPTINYYIELAPDCGEKLPMVPILYSTTPYKGGSFFDYLTWSMMEIVRVDHKWIPKLKDGKPVLHPMKPGTKIYENYLDLVTRNVSGELFHPDELGAQNFVFVANISNPLLLVGMGTILEKS